MSNSYIVTSQKSTPNHPKSSPPHSSLKPQASKLKPPKSATKPTPSAPALSSSSSSSSEDDSDDDNGSSHASDSDSDMDRQIAAQVASLPEGRTRDTAIKKLRRIAKCKLPHSDTNVMSADPTSANSRASVLDTRKLDRNPQKEQRKMGQSGMYEGIGGRARFEELARKWG